jgi:tetratricopeptide (TPR) repeat protein
MIMTDLRITGTKMGTAGALGLVLGGVILDAAPVAAKARLPDGVRTQLKGITADAGDHFQTGRALLAAGDTTSALAAFRTAVAANPQSIDALNGLGVAYDRLGRADLARSAYEAALGVDPTAADVLYNLGYSLYRAGDDRAAIPWLQKAARHGDNLVQAAARRALALIDARLTARTATATPMAAPAVIALAEPQPAAAPQALATAAPARAPMAPRHVDIATSALTVAGTARIDVASDGALELVLDAPEPATVVAAELASSLGDAAVLTLAAAPFTEPADSDALFAEAEAAPAETMVAAALPPAPLAVGKALPEDFALLASAVRPQRPVATRPGLVDPGVILALLRPERRDEDDASAAWRFAGRRDGPEPAEPEGLDAALALREGDGAMAQAVAEAVADAGELVAAAITRLEQLIAAAQSLKAQAA